MSTSRWIAVIVLLPITLPLFVIGRVFYHGHRVCQALNNGVQAFFDSL